MARKNDSWGIEIGADAIKAMHLVRDGGDITLADFDILPFKEILTTPDLDVDEAIQVNLEQFMQRHADVSKSTVMASVAGHLAFARFAKLPPVEPKKIPDIVRFEAVQQIPFPIEEVEWDYQVFGQPDSPEVEVGIFAIMRERVMDLLDNYISVGLNVDGLTLSPLAVYNAMVYDMEIEETSPGTIFVDIGTTSTDVIVVEKGRIWLRTLPLGGNNFTEALVTAFKLSFPKAEKLKREAATSKYARQIYVAMRPVFSDLVQEIQRSLGYYQSLNRNADLTRLIGFGSTFRLPGLRKFLKQQLQIEVVRPSGYKRLAAEGKRASDLANHSLNFATAYGLALQGLAEESVSANILPAQILKQRMWRAKQPWVAAASGLIVASSLLAAGKLWTDKVALSASRDLYADDVNSALNKAESLKREWDAIEVQGSSQQIESFHRVLDYRDVWPKILQDLHDALAQMSPQDALLSADYEQIKAIARGERLRPHVASITSVYEYEGMGESIEEIFADPEQADVSENEDEDSGGYRERGGMAMAQPPQMPPAIVVTVSGTTSHERGRQLLSAALTAWLAENAERVDRPYTIVPVGGSAGLLTQRMGGNTAASEERSAGRSRRGGSRSRNARRSTGQSDRETVTNNVTDISAAGMLPAHPLAEEPAANDWQFEIIWKFRLKPPEDARAAEGVQGTDGSRSDQRTGGHVTARQEDQS